MAPGTVPKKYRLAKIFTWFFTVLPDLLIDPRCEKMGHIFVCSNRRKNIETEKNWKSIKKCHPRHIEAALSSFSPFFVAWCCLFVCFYIFRWNWPDTTWKITY